MKSGIDTETELGVITYERLAQTPHSFSREAPLDVARAFDYIEVLPTPSYRDP